MFDFDVLTLFIGIIFLGILCFFIKYRFKKDNIYLLFFSVFFIYLLFVLKYTIFPIPIDTRLLEEIRNGSAFVLNFNMIPFNFDTYSYFLHSQVLYNILLSIPFGFGISYISTMKKKRILMYGIVFGLIIESLQLIISLLLKYNYRVIDINDVIFNFIGIITGYFIFRIFSFMVIKIIEKFDIKLNKMLNYIYSISKQSSQV